jgi:hypothetical protein
VVVSLTSLTSMTESLSKLAPFTVRVNAVDPAGTFDGATDEMEGVVVEGLVGEPGVVVDEEVPPQPLKTRQEKRQRTTAASTQRPTRLMGLGSFVLVFGGTSRLISFLPFAEPANCARRRNFSSICISRLRIVRNAKVLHLSITKSPKARGFCRLCGSRPD